MLSVFLKMCQQLFLFVCVFGCLQAAIRNPRTKCTILPAASKRILETRLMTTGYATPIETSHNTRIHDGKLNQLINIVREFSRTPGLPGSAPVFTQRGRCFHWKCLGEKTNGPSIHLSIFFRLSRSLCHGIWLETMLQAFSRRHFRLLLGSQRHGEILPDT